MLVVHPDRCSHLDVETKFIAKRIFEAINEAYQEFLKKESPDS
jgi:curved DNA-binding protein CbpA